MLIYLYHTCHLITDIIASKHQWEADIIASKHQWEAEIIASKHQWEDLQIIELEDYYDFTK